MFFYVKSESIKFANVNNMWNLSLFIEQYLSNKKHIAISEFVVLAVNLATIVCKFLFLIRTFVKTNSNSMFGSFWLM